MPTFAVADPRDPSGDACLDVEFTIDSRGCSAQTYGPPEDCYPAESAEISIEAALDSTGADVLSLLTDDQHEAIKAKILVNYDFNDRDDFYDGDW